LRGKIYASCEVLGERSEEEGAFFSVRGEPATVESLREAFGQAQ
jgi:GTP-binding protein HflX